MEFVQQNPHTANNEVCKFVQSIDKKLFKQLIRSTCLIFLESYHPSVPLNLFHSNNWQVGRIVLENPL
jgi:hypothetical protein